MTVIAWDGKNLAADRNTGFNAVSLWKEKKIFRIKDCLLGYTGMNTGIRDAFATWLHHDRSPEMTPRLPEKSSFAVILIDCKKREAFFYRNNTVATQFPFDLPIAIGSFELACNGALLMDATAEQAVNTALQTFRLRPDAKFFDIDVLSSEYKHKEVSPSVSVKRVRKPAVKK